MATPQTVWAMLEEQAGKHPGGLAVHDASDIGKGQDFSYRELHDRALRTAAFLESNGIKAGDSVALLIPNCIYWLDVFFAAARTGALLVPLNTRYRENEIHHLLETSKAKILFTAAQFESVDFTDRLHGALSDGSLPSCLEHVVDYSDTLDNLPGGITLHASTSPLNREPTSSSASVGTSNPLIVFGTSGTTSAPKLAIHTNETTLPHLRASTACFDVPPGRFQLSVLSLSGTFGFVPAMAGLLHGIPLALLPIYNTERVLESIATLPIHLIVAAEGSLRDLLDTLTPQNCGGLAQLITAGLAIQDIVDKASALNITARNVYGSSEVFAFAGSALVSTDREHRCLPGGDVVNPSMRIRVIDRETGNTLPVGEVGELQFKGGSLFTHYLNNPEATQKAFTEDGWFKTNDAAKLLAESTFEYLSRGNDTLRLGGYSVAFVEIESAIESMSGVKQAQVVGVKDERSGDDIAVAFVLAEGVNTPNASSIITHCKANLASFKVPKHVEIVAQYPTTPSANGDKVRRDSLRQQARDILSHLNEEGSDHVSA
ncbi:AMP-binding protein [Salinicola acroporae]|uniref:Uncharacterized protein n=1 Tax=Salinicola acroporae TaxID=1541440 RepID=A0ABT6I6G5_9GAMM|nr:AMP-binding protein [Salinicola acroporae]MDH4572850.1 hypothetical protein [Salinicola acroporae]